MILAKGAKIIQWGKICPIQQMVLGKLGIHIQKKDVKLLPLHHIQKLIKNVWTN